MPYCFSTSMRTAAVLIDMHTGAASSVHSSRRRRWLRVLLVLAVLASCAAVNEPRTMRRLLIRNYPQGSCRNTVQGPWYMTDDRGHLCPAQELDYSSGCCTTGKLHTCDTCSKEDGCCENYEHCVSCCMSPDHKPDERRRATLRVSSNPQSGFWKDVFEYCTAACRTHARSTAHENAYIGSRHHCFSKLGKPLLSPPLPPGSLDGVTLRMGSPGASCDATCTAAAAAAQVPGVDGGGLACSSRHLPLLNTCDRLREHVACEAGCQEEAGQPSMPGIVDADAPKASRPALCLVAAAAAAAGAAGSPSSGGGADSGSSPAAKPSPPTCDAAVAHMRRLCPCVKAPAAAGGATQAAAAGSSSSTNGSGGGATAAAAGTGTPAAGAATGNDAGMRHLHASSHH